MVYDRVVAVVFLYDPGFFRRGFQHALCAKRAVMPQIMRIYGPGIGDVHFQGAVCPPGDGPDFGVGERIDLFQRAVRHSGERGAVKNAHAHIISL